ncbi:hypothetical protein JXR01_00250 [Candidatus Kaiserbacteria bacterium]|nr:MAG: hypothetical protein JXR01_00250 [Candidatus Kaiserbacteria bacterium]
MNKNTLHIDIDTSVEELFAFTIDPNNTGSWVGTIEKEIVDAYPIGLGTIYTNDFSKLVVSAFIPNELFELSEINGEYRVRYTYTSTKEGSHLEYAECMKDGSDLNKPFVQENLEKLKKVLEE